MKKKVLFLCTGNSCRSQMAEGLLRHLGNGKYEVFSAGTHPCYVSPTAIKVMKEVGIDISSHRSKSVNEFLDETFDYMITVCDNARELCPVLPGKYKSIHWSVEDPGMFFGPEVARLSKFRLCRDDLAERIQHFIEVKEEEK